MGPKPVSIAFVHTLYQRFKQDGGFEYPVTHGFTTKLNAVLFEHRLLYVQWQYILIFAGDNLA